MAMPNDPNAAPAPQASGLDPATEKAIHDFILFAVQLVGPKNLAQYLALLQKEQEFELQMESLVTPATEKATEPTENAGAQPANLPKMKKGGMMNQSGMNGQ